MFNRLKSNSFIKNSFIIFSFIIISLLSICVLYHTHTLYGAGDMRFHFNRIIELRESFKHGIFFPHFAFNQFHGSAVLFLYPYINIIPIVLGLFFIKSWIKLIYLFFCFNTFISLIISFYSSKYFSKSNYLSYLFAIIYSLSAPFVNYYYGNMDFGVSTTLAFLPLIVFGFIYLFTKKIKLWLLFPIGVTLIVYSHVLSTIILIGFLILWLIINIKRLNKFIYVRIIYSIIIIILLTSIVWLPALDLILHNIGNIKPLNAPQLFGYSIPYILKVSLFNYPNFCLGLFAIIGLLLAIILYSKGNIWLKQMFWISIIFLIVCSNIFPWKFLSSFSVFKVLKIFQFTYRFYIIPELLLCYMFAWGLIHICSIKRFCKYKLIIISFVILSAIVLQFFMQKSMINYSSKDKPVTTRFIHYHTIIRYGKHAVINNGHIKPLRIKEKIIIFGGNHHIGYANPEYKITNFNQIKLLCNYNFYGTGNLDYYPMDSVYKSNLVNNNQAFIHHKVLAVKHTKFNTFRFNNKKNLKYIDLPILVYKHENLNIYLNGHIHRFYRSKNGLIKTKIRRGNNRFYIKNIPNKLLEKSICIQIFMGVLGIVLLKERN